MKRKNVLGKCYLMLIPIGILLLLLSSRDFERKGIEIASTCVNLLIDFLILLEPEKTIGYLLAFIKWTPVQISLARIAAVIMLVSEIYYFNAWIEENYTFYYLNWKTIIGL